MVIITIQVYFDMLNTAPLSLIVQLNIGNQFGLR